MSEYQYFEFLAVDQPLDARAQAEVRALSTRAIITPTSFTNTYHFGDFRGDPRKMMQQHYDLHVHVTNWGTHRLMVRVPATLLAESVAVDYTIEPYTEAVKAGRHLVLDFTSEDESAEFTEEAEGWMARLAGVRDEIMAGDLRPLYLAWLAAIGTWERDEDAFDPGWEDELEPAVPTGLSDLTGPQEALAEYLRIDEHLLDAAREASADLPTTKHTAAALRSHIAQLPESTKNRLLLAVANGRHATVRAELLGATGPGRRDDRESRTVGALLDRADRLRQDAHRRNRHT